MRANVSTSVVAHAARGAVLRDGAVAARDRRQAGERPAEPEGAVAGPAVVDEREVELDVADPGRHPQRDPVGRGARVRHADLARRTAGRDGRRGAGQRVGRVGSAAGAGQHFHFDERFEQRRRLAPGALVRGGGEPRQQRQCAGRECRDDRCRALRWQRRTEAVVHGRAPSSRRAVPRPREARSRSRAAAMNLNIGEGCAVIEPAGETPAQPSSRPRFA